MPFDEICSLQFDGNPFLSNKEKNGKLRLEIKKMIKDFFSFFGIYSFYFRKNIMEAKFVQFFFPVF